MTLQTSLNANTLQCRDGLVNTLSHNIPPFAHFNVDPSTSVVFSTTDVWTEISGNFLSPHHTRSITVTDNSNAILIPDSPTQFYLITLDLQLDKTGAAVVADFQVGLGINGNDPTFVMSQTGTITSFVSAVFSGSAIDPMRPGDVVKLYAKALPGSSTVAPYIFQSGTLTMMSVGLNNQNATQ